MKNLEKLSFSKIQNVLSKSEMKMIMAGSDGSTGYPKIDACIGKDYGDECIYTIDNHSYSGKCASYFGPKFCSTLN
jgi:hypothetical protein